MNVHRTEVLATQPGELVATELVQYWLKLEYDQQLQMGGLSIVLVLSLTGLCLALTGLVKSVRG